MTTITNPSDPSKTFTYGKRGKRPNWVKEYEITHGVPASDKKPVEKTTEEPIEYEIEQRGEVIYNRTLNTKYKIGQRGRRPTWLIEYLEEQSPSTKPTPQPKNAEINSVDGMREWIFNQGMMNAKCIVVAEDSYEAVKIINSTFAFPATQRSLQTFWKEIPHTSILTKGIWKYDDDTTQWITYEPTKQKLAQLTK